MAEVYSQDVNVKTDIKGLPKNSDALAKLTRAMGHNIGAIKGLTQALQKAGEKAITAVNNTQGNTQKLSKPVKELEKAGSKAGAALHNLSSKMKEFGTRVKENWRSFKRLMGIMKSVVLVGGAVTAVFGAIVAALATAQSKKRSATAAHFMDPAKLDALKYTESTLKTDGQVLQMLDRMGEAVLDPENYGAFKQLGIDPEEFRKRDAEGRFKYTAPILKQVFQGLSDADISKNALVYEPFSKIAGDPAVGRQFFGTRDTSGAVHEGIADDISEQWKHWQKYTRKVDYKANAEASKKFNTALTSLQITFDTLAAKAAPKVTEVLEALNKAFKKLEPTILKLIDKLPYFIDQLSDFLKLIGVKILGSTSDTKLQRGKEITLPTAKQPSFMNTLTNIGISTAGGAAAGFGASKVMPGQAKVATLALGTAAGFVKGLWDEVTTSNKTGALAYVDKQRLDDLANAAIYKHIHPDLVSEQPRWWGGGSKAWDSNTESDFLQKLQNSILKMVAQQTGKDVKTLEMTVKWEGDGIRAKVVDTSNNTIIYNQLVGGR